MKTGQLITFSAACLISANAIRQDLNGLDQLNVYKGTSDLSFALENTPVEETPVVTIPTTDLVVNEPEVAPVVEAAAPIVEGTDLWEGTSDLTFALENTPWEETPVVDLVVKEPEAAPVVETAAPVVEENDIWVGTSDLTFALENTPVEETPVVTIPMDLVVNESEAAPSVTAAAPDSETAAEAAAEDAEILEQIKADEEASFAMIMEEMMRQEAEMMAAQESGFLIDLDEEEPMDEDQISIALFDLNQMEIDAIQAMDEEIVDQQEQVMADAVSELAELEDERTDLQIEADEVNAKAAEVAAEVAAEEEDAASEPFNCDSIVESYILSISDLQGTLEFAENLTNVMAESLSMIDPNMDNGDEGKAFLRKMYKLRN